MKIVTSLCRLILLNEFFLQTNCDVVRKSEQSAPKPNEEKSRSPDRVSSSPENSKNKIEISDSKSKDNYSRITDDNSSKKPDEVTKKLPKIYTEDQLNKMGAKIIKAELLGNLEQAKKLKVKLEMAKKETEEALEMGLKLSDQTTTEVEEVQLMTTNSRGG